ncbi:MAG: NusG domain II-containing protein, partial [Elusimicrobiota bacterium]
QKIRFHLKRLYRTTVFDYLLAILILFFSAASLFPFKKNNRSFRNFALIYKDDSLIEKLDLSTEKKLDIHGAKILIRNGGIEITSSDCPQKICAHTGRITRPGQTIICVPKKMIIEITGAGKKAKYDAISY